MTTDQPFCLLIGENLTSRARSPILWSAAFEAHGQSIPMDCQNIEELQLRSQLLKLFANEQFLGGAVAAPHKRSVAAILGKSVDDDVRIHGCVNCLYRDKEMIIRGANTDGIGAMRAINDRWGRLSDVKAVLLGLGGVGRPIARELSLELGPGHLIVASRRPADRKFVASIAAEWVPWDNRLQAISGANLIVNCTSVGAGNTRDRSPLSCEEVGSAPSDARLFDVIYDPSPSKLLEIAAKRGLETLDGKSMNLFQAELAFAKCFSRKDLSITNKAMSAAFANLE